MKKNLIKSVSVLLAMVMLCCCMPMSVFAAEDSISVKFSAFDGTVIMPMQALTVTDGIAESYGYEIPEADHNGEAIEDIVVLDVLVAAHKACYGAAFTPETAENYLYVDQYNMITIAFGKNARSSSFAVNNAAPHDDNYNELWGSYTGYGANEAIVADGDYIAYFFYQDTAFYGDYYAWFEAENEDALSLYAVEGDELALTLKGFCYGWYSCSPDEAKGIEPLEGVDVYLVEDGKYTSIGKTDENGHIKVKIEDAGNYHLCAYGEDSVYEIPVSAAWTEVEVVTVFTDFWNQIVEFFRSIFDAIANLFK